MQHGSASQIMGLWDTMGDQLSWADWFTSHQLSHLYLTRIIHIDTHSTSCYNNSQSQIFYSYAPTNGFFVSSFPVTCTRSQISEPLVRRTKPKDIGKPFFFVVNNIFLVGKQHDCWFHSSIPGSLGKPTPTSETECWLLIWFITQDIHRNPKPFKTA